jgi:hypothetical protein
MGFLREIIEKKRIDMNKNRKINETVIGGKQTGPNEDKRNMIVKWKKVQ